MTLRRERGDRAAGRLVFRSPRLWADIGMIIVLLPIAAAALTLLLALAAVPLLLRVGIEPDDSTLMKWCAAAAIPIAIVAARRRFFWSIGLKEDVVRLGRIWPHYVRYDRVRFIKAGRDFDPNPDVT